MINLCPTCRCQTPRLLEAASRDASVNYYRCDHCGTVWNTPKNADNPIRIVAKFPSQSDDDRA
jgi:hypothetical protein